MRKVGKIINTNAGDAILNLYGTGQIIHGI